MPHSVPKNGKSPMLCLSRTNWVGLEVRDNRWYGGNGQIASGPAQPLVMVDRTMKKRRLLCI